MARKAQLTLTVEVAEAGRPFKLTELAPATRVSELADGVVSELVEDGGSWPVTLSGRRYFAVVRRRRDAGWRRLALATTLSRAGVRSKELLRIEPGLDTGCLDRLYRQGGTLRADALRAGLPPKAVPFDLERNELTRRILEELEASSALPELFVLAALQWPEDEELRRNLSQLATEGEPERTAPRAMAAMRRRPEDAIRRIWRETRAGGG